MFERIKACVNARKYEKFLEGMIVMGKITNNPDTIHSAEETLCKSKALRKRRFINRNVAKEYNVEILKMVHQKG